jgi:hypothetical protein
VVRIAPIQRNLVPDEHSLRLVFYFDEEYYADPALAKQTAYAVRIFENIAHHLGDVVTVPFAAPSSINLYDRRVAGSALIKTFYDADIVIKVEIGPRGENPWAVWWDITEGGHPISGMIMLPRDWVLNLVDKMEGGVQSYDSARHDTFDTLLHETFHAMGVAGTALGYWQGPDGIAYGKVGNVTVTIPVDGCPEQAHVILRTPKARKWAEAHGLCVSASDGVCGILWDNHSVRGSQMSHPLASYALQWLMSPVGNLGTQITDGDYALLEDTGWYRVNYSTSRYSTFGFGLGPSVYTDSPARVLGVDARRHSPGDAGCSYDLRHKTDFEAVECKVGAATGDCAKPYFNPYNSSFVRQRPQLDTPVDFPIVTCAWRSGVTQAWETFGGDSFCYELVPQFVKHPEVVCLRTKCLDGGSSLELTAGPSGDVFLADGVRRAVCENAGDEVVLQGRGIRCPAPAAVCAEILLASAQHPAESNFDLPAEYLRMVALAKNQSAKARELQTRLKEEKDAHARTRRELEELQRRDRKRAEREQAAKDEA